MAGLVPAIHDLGSIPTIGSKVVDDRAEPGHDRKGN
jgi:hypothetical protein